ncbi:MAG: patatin-like phospholipase family protein [Pseudomonadota bacterium]
MRFDNVVFAGGGSRCMWQVGFWEGAKQGGLDLQASAHYLVSTSAGSAMATACALGRGRDALDMFMEMTAQNPRNIYWNHLLPGSGKPLLPHMAMYRKALEDFLQVGDLESLGTITLEFLMARYPRWMPSGLGALLAFTVYGLEKHLTGVLHPSWTQRLGFQPLVAGNRDVDNERELIDVILASSTVPPVLPTGGFCGQRVLDGGIIDNVPAFLADAQGGNTLVLLSKRYRQALPAFESRCYVQPSEPIKIDKFDYANPQGLKDAFELGRKDALKFLSSNAAVAGEVSA